MNSLQYKQKIMERKLTKKELMEEMFPQNQANLDIKEGEIDENEFDNILDECDEENTNDLKEARERIYGKSQTTELKRLYRLFNKIK